jgi:hypothetical protein
MKGQKKDGLSVSSLAQHLEKKKAVMTEFELAVMMAHLMELRMAVLLVCRLADLRAQQWVAMWVAGTAYLTVVLKGSVTACLSALP